MLLALGIEFRDQRGEYWARCPHPNHHEKTGSWSISDTGSHHCFGCKWEGGPLELVMRVVDLSTYGAAHQWLLENGLYLDGPVPLNVKVKVTRPAIGATEVAIPEDARFKPLDEWVTPAKRYALKRGITAEQVTRWRLGYAAGGYYANRILLPTYSRAGALLNITGRAWSSTKTPKYLNAKEQHGWNASAVFGEEFWPEIASRSTLVLCEGEFNALACERVGAKFVGALGGSELEKEQVMKLSQFQHIILATDIDKAGSAIAAALRATLVRWRRCTRVMFPDQRDPNDLERQDPTLLRRLLWANVDQGA
jgi:DNA primase